MSGSCTGGGSGVVGEISPDASGDVKPFESDVRVELARESGGEHRISDRAGEDRISHRIGDVMTPDRRD